MKKVLRSILAVLVVIAAASSVFAGTITIQGTIPDGQVGKTYRATFSATSTSTTHISRWNFRGTIPGLVFTGVGYSGTLSGTPSAAGRFSCSVSVVDAEGNSSDPFQFSFTIAERDSSRGGGSTSGDVGGNTGGTLSIGGYLNASSVGTSYPDNNYGELIGKATADGGTPPYRWSVISGDLPKGLCLACSSTGLGYNDNNFVGPYAVLSGIAALEGTYNFRLRVTDSMGQSAEKDFSTSIQGGNIDDISIGGRTVGEVMRWYGSFPEYSENFILVTGGGRSPFTWSKIGGELPESVTVSTDTDNNRKALISGTPSEGKYYFVVKVTDADGRSAKKAFSVTYSAGDNTPMVYGTSEDNVLIPEITGSFAPTTVGEAYSGSASVSGDTAPYIWSVSYGQLPLGLILSCSDSEINAGTGTTGRYAHITGNAETEGFYTFVLKVTDSNNITSAKTFTVKVNASENDIESNSPTGNNISNNINSNDQTGNSTGNDTNSNQNSSSSGGGGGCEALAGILGIAVALFIFWRQK